ncbi:unnamed protein product [Eruca vesicaria subsp. sativa]|uniref:Uncharacterized protein n=1 Tax=Eruca vesicaria subsp. sativa TaxID=29727 RepID=A0ABC8M6X0_ERUVS|nr:unnamed protein product [Eruca vesicaria subsp. sativa]
MSTDDLVKLFPSRIRRRFSRGLTRKPMALIKKLRKVFPLFCSDREYVIGRRIWNCGETYYCVTKGVSVPCLPRNNKQKRVDLFYTSWCIGPVESRRDDGVTNMGIPREIAKLGVRRGMWGAVKKMELQFCLKLQF